jgi:uncharacterized protein (DUF934 family)
MALVKNGELAASSFIDVSGAEAIPAAGPVIVSLDQWKAHRDELLKRGAELGIRLHSDQPPELVAADLPHFAVVALEFPKFRDGRAYSYARLLRERYGFKGELRAVGDVLIEQCSSCCARASTRSTCSRVRIRSRHSRPQWPISASGISRPGMAGRPPSICGSGER